MLSDRSLGWLRYLDAKAHTPDRWDREGRPHPHWDGGRADLLASGCALGLMAERTLAWTERHVAVLDQLIRRHTAWWSLDGWIDAGSPAAEPRDPVGEPEALGWTGSLLVLLGIRAALSAEDPWNEPFPLLAGTSVASDGGHHAGYSWTHTGIAETVAANWPASATGTDREAELIVAGLGLQLHDRRHGTDLHAAAFAPWWAGAEDRVLDRSGGGAAGRTPPAETLITAALLAPQAPDAARRLFDTGYDSLGPALAPGHEPADGAAGPPLGPDRAEAAGAALLLAREWGLRDEADRLAAAIAASYQGAWDDAGGHTWALEADEDLPRGQANAWLAAAEVAGPGRWTSLFAGPWAPCHQVVGVDAPEVLLRRAEWIREVLHVGLAPRQAVPTRWTTFRITGAEPRMWYLTGTVSAMMDTAGNATIVRAPMVPGELELAPGSY